MASTIVSLLALAFPGGSVAAPLSRKQKAVFTAIKNLLMDLEFAEYDVEEEVVLDKDDAEYDPNADADAPEDAVPDGKKIVFSGGTEKNVEEVQAALAYYRSTLSRSRSMDSMSKAYRFIKTRNDIDILRNFEADGEKAVLHRKTSLALLSADLYEWTVSKLTAGIVLHDDDLQRAALVLNMEKKYLDGFKASQSWITKFKKSHRFRSRKITRFVSRRNFEKSEKLEEDIAKFIADIKKLQDEIYIPIDAVFNADQSGFLKEMNGARSLAQQGDKKVIRIVNNVAATTHSCTVMPMIFMDGSVDPRLYVVLQEKNGMLPQRYHNPGNLIVRAHTSHIMTKELMFDWFSTMVVPTLKPAPVVNLMVVDSWSSFKDHAGLQALVPAGYNLEIRNIPAGTTSMGQPLDVGYNFYMKAFEKKLTRFIKKEDIDFPVHQRDNLLKLHSVTHHHFSNPCFTDFILHAWKLAGFIDHSLPYVTPLQKCFPRFDGSYCADGCSTYSFAACSYCCQRFCFLHFVEHRCFRIA